MFFPLSNNFIAIHVSNSLVIAQARLGHYFIDNKTASYILDDDILRFKSLTPVVTIIIYLISLDLHYI